MRAILRAGAYELIARADVPVGSVISEYVDVAHAFYDKRESGFVNGLLDAIAKEARPAPGRVMREARCHPNGCGGSPPIARGARSRWTMWPCSDGLVLTHDTIAEGVHFLPSDPPASVGWKLVAVNLSDLAAKGATPARRAAVADPVRRRASGTGISSSGIEAACESYGLPLIGGDTIALPEGAPRVLGLTAIGRAGEKVPIARRRQGR